MLVISGSLIIVQHYFFRESRDEELHYRAESMTKLLASGMKNAMVHNKFEDLNASVSNIGLQNEIELLWIYDNVGTVISKYNMPNFENNNREFDYTTSSEIFYSFRDDSCLYREIVFPVKENSLLWGHIRIIFNETPFDERTSQYNIFIIMLILLGIVLIFFSSWFITRYIESPVDKLTEAAKKISSGEFSTKVEITRKDEFGVLAKAFNDMSDKITSTLKELYDKNEELKSAHDNIRQMSLITEQIGDGIIVSNLENEIIYANPAWLKMYGYSSHDIMGKHISIIFSGDQLRNKILAIFAIVYQKSVYTAEHTHIRKDGTEFPIITTYSVLMDSKDNKIGIIQVSSDISERKESEKLLIIEKQKAEESNRLKTSFLANMSHELRTPLIGILGFSEVLSDYNNEYIRSTSKLIHKSGTRLLDTLNLILDLSRIEANKLSVNFEETNLVDIISEETEIYKFEANEHGLILKTDFSSKELWTLVDRRLFKQVIRNLIDNAIKYTPEGEIIIKGFLDSENKIVTIEVTDTGIGIAEESFQVIFEEFRQVSEGYSRHFEGSGLGLTLCKRFTEKMNGIISVKSVLAKGSTFSVSFPSIIPYTKTISLDISNSLPSNITSSLNTSKKLLLVENDSVNASLIFRFLEGLYSLDLAINGKDALNKISANKYDAFLLDINLGTGLNGLDIAMEIKKNSIYENTPIIAVTALAMEGDREKILSEGCTHYIAKPFARNAFIEFINSVFLQQTQ